MAPQSNEEPTTSSSSGHRRRRERPQWREAVAGAGAGAFAKTCMAPVERIKLIMQLSPSDNRSAWQVARRVRETQGLASYWRGNLPSVLRTAGTAAVNFTCMDYYKRVAVSAGLQRVLLPDSTKATATFTLEQRRKLLVSLISSGLAGATSTTILYPFEFVRTRLAMDQGSPTNRQYYGMRDVTRAIYKSDGVLGFFQGYGISLVGGIVYRIMHLGGYDALKDQIIAYKASRSQHDKLPYSSDLNWGERLASAQFISLAAGSIAYPFDSVRRRMMMQAGQERALRAYRSSVHCITMVLRLEGVRGFYRGLAPNLVRSVGGALLLVAYDGIRGML